jgi:glyoxylase-like metal-dependent hydrolase (beta-lactamase superfamily II)
MTNRWILGLTVGALLLTCSAAMAQFPSAIVPEGMAKQVSPHVWEIKSFPNIAIVVGDRATLVVDTGLGARNGATIAREARKLSKGTRLYLTTTHFHPEHAAGDEGFPADTILIRNAAQQKELEEHGAQFIELFRSRSPEFKELLTGQKFRKPDVVFDREARIDLGGVTARLLWLGAAHTVGDELAYVEEDGTLITGDVVQNKVSPGIATDDSSVKSWIAVVDQLPALNAKLIVPDHSDPGDAATMIAQERAFLGDIETFTLAAKREGKSADDAAAAVAAQMKTKYADWSGLNGVPNMAKRAYAEQ